MRKAGILAIQVGWTKDKDDNLRRTLALIEEAMQSCPAVDLICLPEMYYVNPTRKNPEAVGMPLWNPLTCALADCARKHHVNIVTGCFPWKSENGMYNTCLCLDRNGEIVNRYSKTHLFDAMEMRESDLVKAGDKICNVDLDFGRVGIAICYELRFPEYLASICKENVELLCIPAAFYVPRSEAWDLLTRAAALQNQVYLCAVNQYNRFYLGRSRIVNPEGEVIGEIKEGEGFAYAEVDLDTAVELRQRIRRWENRREDLY